MFSPNPAPSTAGSGYTRARTPQGGHDPNGAKRYVPHGEDHRGADGDGARVTDLSPRKELSARKKENKERRKDGQAEKEERGKERRGGRRGGKKERRKGGKDGQAEGEERWKERRKAGEKRRR